MDLTPYIVSLFSLWQPHFKPRALRSSFNLCSMKNPQYINIDSIFLLFGTARNKCGFVTLARLD